jgi:hypothetical protein
LTVVLLCFEDVRRSVEWCHRLVVSDWLAEGIARLGIDDVLVKGELDDLSSPRQPRGYELQQLQLEGSAMEASTAPELNAEQVRKWLLAMAARTEREAQYMYWPENVEQCKWEAAAYRLAAEALSQPLAGGGVRTDGAGGAVPV